MKTSITSDMMRSRRLLQAKQRGTAERNSEIKALYLSGNFSMVQIAELAGFKGHQRVQQILNNMGILRALKPRKAKAVAK